jgi:hypothetical protein
MHRQELHAMDHARTTRREPQSGPPAARRASRPGRATAADGLADSPRLSAQRLSLQAAFGAAAQLKGGEDEELLQGRFAVAQRAGPEEEEPLQGRFAGPAQRAGGEEEEPLQARFAVAQRGGAEEDEPLQGRYAAGSPARATGGEAAAPNRTGMPDALKAGVESLSGMDLSDVRVHAGSSRPAQLEALAYAQGNDIHLGPGQEQHLPHEAWHVVQQRQGRVQPTVQMAGVGVNDDQGLEAEADAMGARAAALGAGVAQAATSVRGGGEGGSSTGFEATLQQRADMRKRRNKKNKLRTVRDMLAQVTVNRQATVEEIDAHDQVLHGGQHHALRPVKVNQLLADIDEAFEKMADLNKIDSDALGVEASSGRGTGQVATQLAAARRTSAG